MKLSVVVATNRNAFWRGFCDSLANNRAEMEVIFVGPIGIGEPGLPVPSRFIDIPDPTVGAARCWEIGARAASGDLLGLMADDCVLSPGCLDAVVSAASLPHHPCDTFTARYFHNGHDESAGQRMWSIPAMPLLPVGGFGFTEAHHALGGIDKRFHAVFWDADLYMSLHAAGGRTTLLDGHTCHEQHTSHSLYHLNAPHDGEVLMRMWPQPLHPDMQRAEARQPWEDWVPSGEEGVSHVCSIAS